MKIVHFCLIALMLGMLLLLSACETSLRNDKRYAPFIGQKFKTKKDMFLVERRYDYSLEGERNSDFMIDSKPTFDEFRNGVWVDKIKSKRYRLIISAGTEVQLVDIIHVTNPEVGDSLRWYGIFVSPPKGVDLEKKILLDADYSDYGDQAPLVPSFIHKEGPYRGLFTHVDK